VKGKIVLVPFPFTDLSAAKRRPCIVIYERASDVLVAFISSVIPKIIGLNTVLIKMDHPEFPMTGLKKESVIYVDKLATLSKSLIIGELGEVGKNLKKKFNKAIRNIIKL